MLQDAKGRVSKPVRCSAPGQAQQMLIYTAHAQRRMALRQIERLWIEVTINQPERSEPDPRDPALTRAWRRIPERNRVLRVVSDHCTPQKG